MALAKHILDRPGPSYSRLLHTRLAMVLHSITPTQLIYVLPNVTVAAEVMKVTKMGKMGKGIPLPTKAHLAVMTKVRKARLMEIWTTTMKGTLLVGKNFPTAAAHCPLQLRDRIPTHFPTSQFIPVLVFLISIIPVLRTISNNGRVQQFVKNSTRFLREYGVPSPYWRASV
ncbi:hypothetical protein BDZ94DRAFT_1237598 [Collybia nuda]|uniref:Uncharacterized protein n=1 Tax=Collybia nuda TaxID=64659 RepID=A0A9P5Y373_9AGAR|nr:hypothetical protein BDZ94DRAFT_1237598 [Collybia nuda]